MDSNVRFFVFMQTKAKDRIVGEVIQTTPPLPLQAWL